MRDLVQRIVLGDSAAEDLLARTFEPRLRTMLLIRTRNLETARDLTQDTFIGVLESLRSGSLRDPDKLAGFVAGVARNVLNNYFRTRDPEPVREPVHSDLVVRPEAGVAAPDERVAAVRQEIATLDPIDRQILTMTLVDGAKPGLIASRLGLSGDTVRQRKLRATRKIAARLSQMAQEFPRPEQGDPNP